MVRQTLAGWGDTLRTIDPDAAHDAAAMVAAAGLDWSVEQHALEAVVGREYQTLRLPIPRHVANVRSDTRAVLSIVGEGGTSPSRTTPPSPSATPSRRDVDLERGTIRFREKGGKVTVKPLPDELAAIIRAADENRVWSSGAAYLIPNRRPHRDSERSPKVIYDAVKKLAARVGVTAHVHSSRAAFAVQFDEQNPGRVIALKELLGHARWKRRWCTCAKRTRRSRSRASGASHGAPCFRTT